MTPCRVMITAPSWGDRLNLSERRKSSTLILPLQCPDFMPRLENELCLVSRVFCAQRSIKIIFQASTMVFTKKALKISLPLDEKAIPWYLFCISDGDMTSFESQALLRNWINILAHRKGLTACFRCFKILLVFRCKQSDSLLVTYFWKSSLMN